MNDLDQIFELLNRSRFRSGFKLKSKDLEYLYEKGVEVIMVHASDFIDMRIAPAFPKNDGKQTPFGKHPVFTAQHATGTCCRNCLEKWHNIQKGSELNEEEKKYILFLIKKWLDSQIVK